MGTPVQCEPKRKRRPSDTPWGAFADEKIADTCFEKVVPDDEHGVWRITVGFSRPRGVANRSISDTVAEFSMLTGGPLIRRLYKVVTIKDASNEGVSLTDRDEQ
jgi:hypothetical protein